MYICQDCGLVFDEVMRIFESHGEVHWGCPSCRSRDVAEAEYCDWCGEAHACEDMDWMDGAYVCRRCIEEEEDDEDC